MATQSIQSFPPAPLEPVVAPVPPLETGDVLTRPQFERRYEAMPWLKKAELVDGVVYVGSPVSDLHAGADSNLSGVLFTFAANTPGTGFRPNATVRFDLENEVQPDALLRIVTGGQSRVEKYIEGPPELVAEVATSSVSRDLHSKLALYRRHGVREYIVWRTLERDIDWFRLNEGNYERLAADEHGIVRSQEFPGLWLDRPALLRADTTAALATLNAGLASPEHAAFVEQLAARK
jgi:Uma2 family endonuclease